MGRYAFAGLILDAELALPLLREAPADAPPSCRVRVRRGARSAAPQDVEAWQARVVPSPCAPDAFTIEFPGGVTFDVAADDVLCIPAEGVPDQTVHHLLLDHVLPRVLSLRGALVLHASVLAPAGRGAAVAFLGASGAGKSTLAASLVGAGWSLVSDDALVIAPGPDGPLATPTYPCLRLWPELVQRLASGATASPVAHFTEKLLVPSSGLGGSGAFSFEPVPLARVYVLDEERAPPAIQPLAPGQALRAAFEAQLRLASVDRPSLQRAFDRIVASGVLPRFRRLSFARDLTALSAVRAAVVADLRGAVQEASGVHSAV